MIRFLDPLYLLLLIPIFAGLALTYPKTGGMVRSRKRVAYVLRGLLATILVLALAGPEAKRANQGVATIFLVDRSDSIGDGARREQDRFLSEATRRIADPDAAGVVVFGRDAKIESSPAARPLGARLLSKVAPAGSDLAGAVRLASAMFPDGKARRLVVLSDGNATQGDLEAASEVAREDGAEIDVVPLGADGERKEVVVLGLESPTSATEKQPIELRANIESNVATDALVELDADGVSVARQSVRLAKGANSIVLPARTGAPGFRRYRVTVRADGDADARNNIGASFTRVNGPTKVLLVSKQPAGGALGTALRKSGIAVEAVSTGGMPTRSERWIEYDAILLDDVNALGFTPGQMTAIAGATRDAGVGFAMIGGEDAFLPGGWYGTPVAEALPVSLDIKQRKSFAAASIAIIADASGSMGAMEDGQPKIRLAATAAEKTAGMLSPMDRIAVAGSSDGVEWLVPMQSAANIGAIIPQIRRLAVTGSGIYIRPSIAAGAKILMQEQSKTRHLIMLCDGGDSTDWDGALGTAAMMRAQNITTTIVAISDGKDVPELKRLAAVGGGRFFLTEKASQLPAIFTQDAAVMTRSAIEEGAFIPKLVGNEPMLRGAPIAGTPPLLAYCLSADRPLARVALRTAKDDPLLAVWQYGLGQSMAFTSDAQPRWAKRWVGWPGYTAFWSQAVRQIGRKVAQGRYEVAATQEGGRGKIRIKASDSLGNPIDGWNAKVRLSTPDGNGRDVAPNQVGPGTYEAAFDADTLGSYIVSVAEAGPGGGLRIASSGFAVPYPPEYRITKPNRPLLERVAKRSGGLVDSLPGRAMRPATRPGGSTQPLWPLLLAIAPIVLILDIAVRRLALPFGELFSVFRRPAVAPVRDDRLERLRSVKERVAAPASSPPPGRTVATGGASFETIAPVAAAGQEVAPEPVKPAPAKPDSTTGTLLANRRKRENKPD